MSVVESKLRTRLATLTPTTLELNDDSAAHAGHAGAAPGGATHWRVRLISTQFVGKSTIARHRMVYAAIGDLMNQPIHALQIQALTPEEAARQSF